MGDLLFRGRGTGRRRRSSQGTSSEPVEADPELLRSLYVSIAKEASRERHSQQTFSPP